MATEEQLGLHIPEIVRLREDARRQCNWKRWGPYLAERQWGTVREDYSAHGESWTYFPHDHARSRAYRWGEDGLLGITDRQGRLCFALALWNERDSILKERLFGLTGPQGNHGEDVKEMYFYLDSTPTHSYMKALYKYPQRPYPYQELVDANRRRGKTDPEFELIDTGIFDDDRYFDVFVEYAKAGPNDVLVRISVHNRGPDVAPIHVLPTLCYRNTWSHGRRGEGHWPKPKIERVSSERLLLVHDSLGEFAFLAGPSPDGGSAPFLFTDNETNVARVFGGRNEHPYVKDSFHQHVIHGRSEGLHPRGRGTKAAAHYQLAIAPGDSVELRCRLSQRDASAAVEFTHESALSASFDEVFTRRQSEANEFYHYRIPTQLSDAERLVVRQAYAGLLWTKQFYNYSVSDWLEGDPNQPTPPDARHHGRNRDWKHLYNRDVISMPDKWEYPWYAAWDLAFHMLPFAGIDAQFSKDQLQLFVREWFMHPNGQIPAYEFAFSDVNPPVHAWSAWRTYKRTGKYGARDTTFLKKVFHKLLLNFTWWINRKDRDGRHIFTGGFLGLDNIGVFDRSQPSPLGGSLDQADATAWMAFYCATMLSISLELANEDPAYEDVASKFFEHFVAIADAINTQPGHGLWEEEDGFYYDYLRRDGEDLPLRIRSIVGLIPLITVEVLDEDLINRMPGFNKRMQWFLKNRQDLAQRISYMDTRAEGSRLLLAIPSRQRLLRILRYLLDEREFLSPFGIRSLSRAYEEEPFAIRAGGKDYRISYVPGESASYMFGGNSNWRGPIWFPINYLIIEALEKYHYFYGDEFKVECPVGSGQLMNLKQVAQEIAARLAKLFVPDQAGRRAAHGQDTRFAKDPHWRDLVLFYEYFDGNNGRGLGASHQTGWTSLVICCLEKLARDR